MKRTGLCAIASCVVLLACESRQPQGLDASHHYAASKMVATRVSDLVWNDLGLIPGVKIAVLSGNPGEPGHYVVRLKFPANTRMPAHWHPLAEYATLLSGTLLLGMGEKEDPAALQPYLAGSFLVVPPRMPHYGRSEDEAIFELSGPGPYEVVFVNPADDPRKK
jgi:quercetin dioxygenase-like cupin family protein